MKKILIALTIVISCLGISNVNAETLYLTDTSKDEFIFYRDKFGSDNFNAIVEDILNEYKNNYMSSYPYFIISPSFEYFLHSDTNNYVFSLKVSLSYYKEIPTLPWTYSQNGATGVHSIYTRLVPNDNYISRMYYIYDSSGNYVYDISNYSEYDSSWLIGFLSTDNGTYYDKENYSYNAYLYYMSNFDLYLEPLNNLKDETKSSYIWEYDALGIPKLGEDSLNTLVSFDRNDYLLEPYYLYDSDSNVSVPNIEEINLNDYAYVALSLKDYNKKAFETTIQVKGQYCLTPVYNYGMTERKDILEGTQVDRCSPYYDNYTPIRTYILDNDLKNNAIYYLKSYDTTRDNYVKVDTIVFDITYVTEENKDNPYVTIDGKTYPTIPYDKLTDTAIKSEDEGYVSGAVEQFSFTDIFTAPLDFLKDVWTSITSVFSLITELLSLLPPIMQNFLYASFMLAVVIGLIKIIL